MSVMCIKDIIGRAHLWIRRLSPNVLDEPNNGQPQEVNHTSERKLPAWFDGPQSTL